MKNLINITYKPIMKDKLSSRVYLYDNPIGVWRVTTEGDVEGRPVKDLGVWEGHVCNIAFKLAHESYYGLTFKLMNLKVHPISTINDSEIITSNREFVHIAMDIDSNTWSLSSKDRVKWFKEFLNLDDSSNIKIKESNYYASVLLQLK